MLRVRENCLEFGTWLRCSFRYLLLTLPTEICCTLVLCCVMRNRCWSYKAVELKQQICSIFRPNTRCILWLSSRRIQHKRLVCTFYAARGDATVKGFKLIQWYCSLLAGVYLHDPTCIIAAIDPSLITFAEGVVRVQTTGIMRGLTLFYNKQKRFIYVHYQK